MTLRVVIPPHPVIAHWLSILRMDSTPPSIYSAGLEQLGKWLTYEALRDWLPIKTEKIQTSSGIAEGTLIEASVPFLGIPSLPGGLSLWQGAKELLPNAFLCLGGVPTQIEENAGIIIFADQITTGEQLYKTLSSIEKKQIDFRRVRVITALAGSTGLTKIGESFPNLTIYSACIDPEVINSEQCSPGIGNPSIRLNTRIQYPD